MINMFHIYKKTLRSSGYILFSDVDCGVITAAAYLKRMIVHKLRIRF